VIAAVVSLAVAGSLVHFQTPSGNINCIGGGASQGLPAFVSCLVRKNSWPRLRPKPARCDLDWDPATIELSRRRVSVGSCRGDIGPLCTKLSSDRCTTLAYGRSVDMGPIRCTSSTAGVTCRHRAAPRVGFRIAREGYTLFRR
jgi:Family of unknown function (DUF6636)